MISKAVFFLNGTTMLGAEVNLLLHSANDNNSGYSGNYLWNVKKYAR